MKHSRPFIVLLIVACSLQAYAGGKVGRPKLVIGVVVDQMRWDYLYRYYEEYGEDGFKRLMRSGANCQNTMINYLPSFTGPGHTCVYTGSVPAIHGIAGNEWVDNNTGRKWYCAEDTTVSLWNDASHKKSMSPRNMLVTTVTDELRLATNNRSRVYGVALKDRGSILPAGHMANAAYWYDDVTGTFSTSTYYASQYQHPAWLETFNKRHVNDSLVKQGWKLLYNADRYKQSTADASQYEKGYKGEAQPTFPHSFDAMTDAEKRGVIKAIPQGNSYTIMMAKACMDGEKLGLGGETDFLALSLSSTDYVGHQYGPNSLEIEDTYLRLDREIAGLLSYLDKKYGAGNYLFFLTADHGGAHNPTFLQDKGVPAGFSDSKKIGAKLKGQLQEKFGDSLVIFMDNYQVSLNQKAIKEKDLNAAEVKAFIIKKLAKLPEAGWVVDMEHIDATPLPEPLKTMLVNGYNHDRSGDIQIVPKPGWFDSEGKTTGTTHGTWNPYDTHIPLLWFGWHVPGTDIYEHVNMTDIAATVAAMLHIQMPNGCIGKPIERLLVW